MLTDSERQARELEFHREFARRNSHKIDEPVRDDIVKSTARRPWNGYWSTYDALMALDLAGKRVLIPGCGFGDDAIRLAGLGAEVFASDLSEDLLEITRARAERAGRKNIHFDAMPAEAMTYADQSFDVVFFNDILHHVDIPRTLESTVRVVKPGGTVVVNELYTHSAVQKLRENQLIDGVIHKRMTRFIYGTDRPYITEDERKINEDELSSIERILQPSRRLDFFQLLEGRLFPSRWPVFSRMDRAMLRLIGPLGRYLAGRFMLVGVLK